MYQYCQANPVGYVDPSGHTCEIVQNHYEQYQEYRKQHSEANAAKAYEAVTGKDPLRKMVIRVVHQHLNIKKLRHLQQKKQINGLLIM